MFLCRPHTALTHMLLFPPMSLPGCGPPFDRTQVKQFLSDTRNYLSKMIRTVNVSEKILADLDIVSDFSYAWCVTHFLVSSSVCFSVYLSTRCRSLAVSLSDPETHSILLACLPAQFSTANRRELINEYTSLLHQRIKADPKVCLVPSKASTACSYVFTSSCILVAFLIYCVAAPVRPNSTNSSESPTSNS